MPIYILCWSGCENILMFLKIYIDYWYNIRIYIVYMLLIVKRKKKYMSWSSMRILPRGRKLIRTVLFWDQKNVHSFEKSPKSEYVPECRRFSGNDARLEWKSADDRVIAAGQVVEVVVVIDAGLQFGLLLGQAGGQGLVKETTSSEPKSKQSRKLAALQKTGGVLVIFFREKHLMIGIKDLDIVKTNVLRLVVFTCFRRS